MATLDKAIKDDANRTFLHLWGSVGEGESFDEVVLDPKELGGDASHLRLYSVVRFVQSGITALFYWETGNDHTLMLPLEGAGFVDVSKIDGFLDPKREGWTGRVVFKIANDKPGVRHFSIKLEFVKQRG